MNSWRYALCALLASVFSAGATAGDSGCEIKKMKIKEQMDYARHYGNYHRLQGLSRALERVETYCRDGFRYDNNDRRYRYHDNRDKIRDKEEKVRERREELRRAELSGKPDKIRQKARKLEDANRELSELLYSRP